MSLPRCFVCICALGLAAALLSIASLGSTALADNIWYVAVGGFGDGTSASTPFGTIEQAYQAAYNSTGAQTIDLASGIYGPSSIGSTEPNGTFANGVLDLGGLTWAVSRPSTASSVLIEGMGSVTLSDSGATGGPIDQPRTNVAMIEAFNAYTPGTGITFQNINFNTVGVSSFIDENYQGLPMTFNNDKITLGYTTSSTGWFYTEGAELPPNQWMFNNSSIYLGRINDPAGVNVLGLGYQDFPGPNNDLFDGEGTSTVYDATGRMVTSLSSLYIADRNGSSPANPYPDYYQNGNSFWNKGPGEGTFAENFAVPEPSSLLLFGVGAAGLFWLARRRIKLPCRQTSPSVS